MGSHLDDARHGGTGLRTAIEHVERTLATNGGESWSAELESGLHELGQALEHHIRRTEGADGLLDEILHEAPQLAPRVQRARDDHASLRALVGEARAAAQDDAVLDLRDRTEELLVALDRHRDLGTELTYAAMNVDLQAAD